MKLALTLALSCLPLAPLAVQEKPQPAPSLEEHAWLRQLVGEWEVTSRPVTSGDDEAQAWEARESVRSLGELWVVVEGSMPGAEPPMAWMLTLGYDPRREAFVGTWVDTMQTTLWSYEGRLDEERRALTLEAEGPSMEDPRRTARYRDRIELVAPDHRRMVSSVLGVDGSWTTYMTTDARRVE